MPLLLLLLSSKDSGGQNKIIYITTNCNQRATKVIQTNQKKKKNQTTVFFQFLHSVRMASDEHTDKNIDNANDKDKNITADQCQIPTTTINEETDSLLGILHSKHYSNILKQVYTSASSTFDPLSTIHPQDIKKSNNNNNSSTSTTSSFIIDNYSRKNVKPNIESLKIQNNINENDDDDNNVSISRQIPETRPKETPFLKPVYSLRIPKGLPGANKLLQPPQFDDDEEMNYDQINDVSEQIHTQQQQQQNIEETQSQQPQSMQKSLSQQEIMTVHTETNTPEIMQQVHSNSTRNLQQYSGRFRSDSEFLNDEENFISMAILDAYKYRTNKPSIPVSKPLVETVKYGSMPTQRIGINYSPSTCHLNNHLLEFNDKMSRHPLARLRKSDLTNTQRNNVENYHNNHQQTVKANKDINYRVLLNNYNPDTEKYEIDYNDEQLYSIKNKPNIKTPLELFDQNESETLDLNKLFDAQQNGKATKELFGFAKYYKNDQFQWFVYFHFF